MSGSDQDDPRIFKTGPDGKTRIEDSPSAAPRGESRPMQDMAFSTHILSLNAMALMHLGEVDGVPETERDLEAAQHIIDTLEMLKRKTSGNLNAQETKLLDSAVYDLKVKYLKARS